MFMSNRILLKLFDFQLHFLWVLNLSIFAASW